MTRQLIFSLWPLCSCILTSIMDNNSLIGKVDVDEVSVASRGNINRRREFDRVQVKKTVAKREPRRRCGTSPNSRLNRRGPTPTASSHLQVRDYAMSSEEIYVGIDIAKETFYVATCPDAIKKQLPNTHQGHRQLLKILQKQNVALIVLEATGGYERPLAAELISNSLPVVVANPRQVRDFARGIGKKAKTDPIDAQVLAKFAQIVKPAPKPRSKPQINELSELVRRRRQLNDLLTQESNRLAMICHPKVKKSIQKMIKTLKSQIEEIEQLIRDYIDNDDDFKSKDKILQSVPGVGPQTSAMLIANLPELGTLNKQEIAALVGLAPWNNSSGKYDGQMHIWGGRKDVRSILYMSAFTARRFNPVIRVFSERLEQNGKIYRVMMTACMRKLLIILNTMVREQTLWTPKNYLKNT